MRKAQKEFSEEQRRVKSERESKHYAIIIIITSLASMVMDLMMLDNGHSWMLFVGSSSALYCTNIATNI